MKGDGGRRREKATIKIRRTLTHPQVIALIGTIFSILEGSQSDQTRALQFYVIGQPWYLVSATLSKASICLFFMTLLRRARQWRILLAGLITIMAVINAAFALATYLQCRPLAKVWDPSVAGSCSDPSIQVNFGYAQGGMYLCRVSQSPPRY